MQYKMLPAARELGPAAVQGKMQPPSVQDKAVPGSVQYKLLPGDRELGPDAVQGKIRPPSVQNEVLPTPVVKSARPGVSWRTRSPISRAMA